MLERKNDQMTLQRDLYDNKRLEDEARVAFLEEELGSHDGVKKNLAKQIEKLTLQLSSIVRRIEETNQSRIEQVKLAEQRKREIILQKKAHYGQA
jgi:hypothetical protein